MNIYTKCFIWSKTCTLLFQTYLDRRRQRNDKRQKESNSDCLQTLNDVKEHSSLVTEILTALT